jgi:hypothetical protein
VPGVGGVGTQLQAQVSTLGWCIDDLLITAQADGSVRRLAISAKGNFQVTRSGLPADFAMRAWEQWRDQQGPLNRAVDGLALVTLGTDRVFDAAWREVKNACRGSDHALAMSRIRNNPSQSRVFDSVQKPIGGSSASDEETVELIRRLHVLPVDLQFAHSDTKSQAIAQCRRLLDSGDSGEADALWAELVNVATEVRIRSGTITLPELLSRLRLRFALRHHPDFERDWETLSSITDDYKTRIETELPSGHVVLRSAANEALQAAINQNAVTVVHGESGCGKSALVKSVLEGGYPSWNQVWFGPEELRMALSAARRANLPIRHELSCVLNATVRPSNVLVIDSAERIEASEFVVIRRLLQAILPEGHGEDNVWRVVIVTQPQSWLEIEKTILGQRKACLLELEPLNSDDVKLALLRSPMLAWLAAHDDTIAALRNIRTLAWVINAGAALGSNANRLASHTAIADWLWKYWTEDLEDVQALVMRLAQREASFERSFALTDLDAVDTAIFTRRPAKLPLRRNERTNRIEFDHDLAADWARFQFLKQISSDAPQWVSLAVNPLWTNALRMLGQFLLRQHVENETEWDLAFAAAEAANNGLAGDILLDALCLDPDAERLLTERVEFLLASDAKYLTRLLIRFHHIGTVPSGGTLAAASTLGVFMEAQFRSIVIARWPPVLRFLIRQRSRLNGLVSSALAKVIHAWLTGTPRELGDGALVPFRRELAAMALDMARTVQVEKGHGVLYLTREPLLYTAALAGATDLPVEIGTWALELAGRRETDPEVTRRISEVQRQKAAEHIDRLKTDPEYKAQHEERRLMPHPIVSSRERLAPWPLGANGKVDMDFRTACFKEHALQSLMFARPHMAAEILLALIIEDQPERKYGSSRHEIELGLDFPRDAYPTAFWKSPFFSFLHLAPDVAVGALIALVNFCTERWVAEVMQGRKGAPPSVTLTFPDGSKKAFSGWRQVFDWPQSSNMPNGNLYSALDALERWLTLRLDAGDDISAIIERLFRQGNSAAFVSLLVNVAKYQPSLLATSLAPLLTFPNLYYWDSGRVDRIAYNFVGGIWLQAGEAIFNFARDWTLAAHRQKKLLDVAVELLKTDDSVARLLRELIPTWTVPQDAKEALEFKLLFARLNRDNYHTLVDAETGDAELSFVCPEELHFEVQSWQSDNAKPLEYLLLPERCEQRLQGGQALTNQEAEYLHNLITAGDSNADGDEAAKSKSKLAAAVTLIVLGNDWLVNSPNARACALAIVQTAVSHVPSSGSEIRKRRFESLHHELKFASYAVMHLWMKNDAASLKWETIVLHLLTSGEERTADVVIGIAYANREKLGAAWWRLLRAGVLWSGLIILAPRDDNDERAEQTWSIWLRRLRRFRLRAHDATSDDLDLRRVAGGSGRLDFQRRMRIYLSGEDRWLGKPAREHRTLLDNHFLRVLFGWLIDGMGTGDRSLDTHLALRVWEWDAARAKENAKEKYGEYDLPSQNLGYDILLKLAALTIAAPNSEQRTIWEPVLVHGSAAHVALQHFIRGIYQHLNKSDDPSAFEKVWRAMVEYGLAADWSQPGLWFHGEHLICDLLGFGNEDALSRLEPGVALRMKDLYESWSMVHLSRDEECITRFCYFLTQPFGAALRLDGLRWLSAMLRVDSHWYRDRTGEALADLVATSLSSDAQALSKDVQARQALVEITGALAAKNVPTALTLQERIKLLR